MSNLTSTLDHMGEQEEIAKSPLMKDDNIMLNRMSMRQSIAFIEIERTINTIEARCNLHILAAIALVDIEENERYLRRLK